MFDFDLIFIYIYFSIVFFVVDFSLQVFKELCDARIIAISKLTPDVIKCITEMPASGFSV